MREIRTLEVDKYVPSEKKGLVKHVGLISPEEAFEGLKAHLEKEKLLPDEYFLPKNYDWGSIKELPNFFEAVCSVNWGANEGIYLDISLLYQDEHNKILRFPFATGKTLGESGDDFLLMSRIGAECSMMLNGRGHIVRFSEEEKEADITSLKEKAVLYDKTCEKMNKFMEYMESMHGYIDTSVRKEFHKYMEECGMLKPVKSNGLVYKIAGAKEKLSKVKEIRSFDAASKKGVLSKVTTLEGRD